MHPYISYWDFYYLKTTRMGWCVKRLTEGNISYSCLSPRHVNVNGFIGERDTLTKFKNLYTE